MTTVSSRRRHRSGTSGADRRPPHFEPLEHRRLLTAVQAMDADDFVDSLGVNIRLNNDGTPYDTRFNDVRNRLNELGVRHVRNVAPEGNPTFGSNPNRWGEYINRLNDLGDDGIKSALTFNKRLSNKTPDFNAIDDMLGRIEDHLQGSVEAVIGLNEYDNNAPSSQRNDGTWVDVWRDYQDDLYAEVNSSSSSWVRNLDVVAGPVAFPNRIDDLGNVTDRVDVGSAHYYTESRPENNSRLNEIVNNRSIAFGSKPVYLTEGGYNYASLTSGGISDKAGGKYVPRYLLSNYLAGVERTYPFEFWSRRNDGQAERESHFGLIDYNGNRNVHFYAMRNLIDLLGEATWNGDDWIRPIFSPAKLNYSLSGNTGDVQEALFQKSDGTFYLVLWQDDSVWNTAATPSNPPTGDISNSSASVTVNFHQDVDRVRRYSNLDQNSGANVDQTVNNPSNTFNVSVPDEVVVLEIDTGNSLKIEAEHMEETVGTDWRVRTINGNTFQGTINGSGNGWNNQNSQPRIAYTVANVSAGQYTVDVRGDTSSQGSSERGRNNSFWLRVNGGTWELMSFETDRGGFFVQNFATTFNLTSGDNLVEIAKREDGTRIDWLEFVPTGQGTGTGSSSPSPFPGEATRSERKLFGDGLQLSLTAPVASIISGVTSLFSNSRFSAEPELDE